MGLMRAIIRTARSACGLSAALKGLTLAGSVPFNITAVGVVVTDTFAALEPIAAGSLTLAETRHSVWSATATGANITHVAVGTRPLREAADLLTFVWWQVLTRRDVVREAARLDVVYTGSAAARQACSTLSTEQAVLENIKAFLLVGWRAILLLWPVAAGAEFVVAVDQIARDV